MDDQEKKQQVQDLLEIRKNLDQATKMIDSMLNGVSRPKAEFDSQVDLIVKALKVAGSSGLLVSEISIDTKIKATSVRAVLSVNKDLFCKSQDGRKARWRLA